MKKIFWGKRTCKINVKYNACGSFECISTICDLGCHDLMEVVKRGKKIVLQNRSVFICFDLCFITLDVPIMNSKV
jgi:hypothetical protein